MKEIQKQLNSKLAALNTLLTSEKMNEEIAFLCKINEEKLAKLRILNTKTVDKNINSNEKAELSAKLQTLKKICGQTKAKFKAIQDTILENIPLSPSEFATELNLDLKDYNNSLTKF